MISHDISFHLFVTVKKSMFIQLTCHAPSAPEVGYLLGKHPSSVFEREFSAGRVLVFYPEVSEDRVTIALVVEIDPVGLVCGPAALAGLDKYVNDWPYVASSLVSVALHAAFSSALAGKCREHPERVVFEHARPRRVVVTMPNREYNAHWVSLGSERLRHADHRFEWTRAECQVWAERVAARYGYRATRQEIGPSDPELGAPSQLVLFDGRMGGQAEVIHAGVSDEEPQRDIEHDHYFAQWRLKRWEEQYLQCPATDVAGSLFPGVD